MSIESAFAPSAFCQRHFTSIDAGIYQGASHLQLKSQLDEARQAHKRLVELRRVTCTAVAAKWGRSAGRGRSHAIGNMAPSLIKDTDDTAAVNLLTDVLAAQGNRLTSQGLRP